MIHQITATTKGIMEDINRERERAGLKLLVKGTDAHMNIYCAIYIGVEKGFEGIKEEMTSAITALITAL